MTRQTNELAVAEAIDTRRNQGPKEGPPKRVHIGLNVDEATRAAIFERAVAEKITISEWLRRAIRQAL